jgi:invasion protein IalB
MRRFSKAGMMRRQASRKFRSRRLGLVAAAICLWVTHGHALAQTEMLKPKSSQGGAVPAQEPVQQATALQPDWAVNCATVQTELTCVASQSFFVKETGQRFMTVSVNPPRGDKKTTLVLQLPLGIYLPAGVSMQFGKAAAKTIPIISCDQNGCTAEYTATDAEVKSMLSGENLLVAVQARDQKPLSVNVPFDGFDTAYSKLR